MARFALLLLLAACTSSVTPDGGGGGSAVGGGSATGGGSPIDGGGGGGGGTIANLDAGTEHCGPNSIGKTGACHGITRTVMGRDYCVQTPAGYSSSTPTPVLMLLHGLGAAGQPMSDYLGLDALTDLYGVILIKPDGTAGPTGDRYWNAGPECCVPPFTSNAPDDSAYLAAVVDDVKSAFNVDAKRVYLMGHSNGAFMSQRLACDHTGTFAAVVSLAGGVDPIACHPSAPISFLEVHGTADFVIVYGGGTAIGESQAYPSAEDTVKFWRLANSCGALASDGKRDFTCDIGGEETDVSATSCDGGVDVALWKMNLVGHVPTFNEPTWPQAALTFLLSHRR